MSTYRVLAPVSVPRQTMTFPGNGGAPRAVSAEPGEFLDVGASDMNALTSNGWILIALVGPTAQRPTPPDPMTLLDRSYLDTDLGELITFDGATWRDPDEANFGEVRYRVHDDGTITVPHDVAIALEHSPSGFVETETPAYASSFRDAEAPRWPERLSAVGWRHLFG